MIARVLLVVLAAAAIAFMSIWLSDFNALNAATGTLLSRHASREQLQRGLAEARRAKRVSPSTDPELAIYGLLVRLGRTDEARQAFASIVRHEPDNRTAWSLLAVTTQRTDPAAFARALMHLHELSPLTTRRP
jgi:lipopolysaccharide biosynthesis regulator YciM